MLNPYALLMGLFSLTILALHGANYLTWKTTGPVQDRSRVASARLWPAVVILFVAVTATTFTTRVQMLSNYRSFVPWLLVPAAALLLLPVIDLFRRRQDELRSFLSGGAFILALMSASAIGMWPYLLLSKPHLSRSFTVHNAAAGSGTPYPAIFWVVLAMVLVTGYTVFVYRTFKGNVVLDEGGHY
jgi:cytochrome bd ubiquinol oxidase subunit II